MFRKYPSMKELHIGVTGSRAGVSYKQLRTFGQIIMCHVMVEYLPVFLHHGDCFGADEIAHDWAKASWFSVIIHPPDDDRLRAFRKTKPEWMRTPKPYIERNHDIVDESHVLVAMPDGEEHLKSGTWATVRYARKVGRPIFIAMPDGKLLMEGRWP